RTILHRGERHRGGYLIYIVDCCTFTWDPCNPGAAWPHRTLGVFMMAVERVPGSGVPSTRRARFTGDNRREMRHVVEACCRHRPSGQRWWRRVAAEHVIVFSSERRPPGDDARDQTSFRGSLPSLRTGTTSALSSNASSSRSGSSAQSLGIGYRRRFSLSF